MRGLEAMDALTLAGIINYNRADLTLRTLKSLRAGVGHESVNLCVVDSASNPEDVKHLAASLPSDVELHVLPVNRGFGHAANAILNLARERHAAWAWILNNDVEIEQGALERLLESASDAPDAAAVGPVVLSTDRSPLILSAGLHVDLWRGRVVHRYWHRTLDVLPDHAYAVGGVEGSAPLIRVAAVERIGGFDEGFFMYWEDIEWCHRALAAGWRLIINPKARIRHAVAQSSPGIQRTQLMLRNRIRFMRMWASPLQNAVFAVYFGSVWLPAYFVARLAPQFGLRTASRIIWETLRWNLAEARRSRSERDA